VQPIWRTLLEQQLERESGLNASTVLDTCALDYWVLWQRWSWCSASPEKAESLYQRLLNVAGEYGLLVRMPAIQLAPPAGHRFINAAYAVQIYRLVTSAISEVAPDVPTVNLDAASPETQLQRTLTRVKDLIAAAR
jgi:hypothetical protein